MTEVVEKDISIMAYPEKNEAHCYGNTADGFIFCGSAKDPKIVSGGEVNKTIAAIREKGLTYSFRKAETCVE